MPLTTAQAALQVRGAKAITLILAKPRDPAAADALVPVGIASGNFITEPADTLSSFPFDGLLAEGSGVRFSEFLIRAGASPAREGGSEIGRGDLEIEARDEQASWRDLDWNGAEFTAYVGARHRADGQRMVFSEFDPAFTGLVERMDALGDRRWRMSFADPRAALEEPATVKFYRGFGGGFRIVGEQVALGDRVRLKSDGNASLTLQAPWTLEWIGRYVSQQSGETTLFEIGNIRVWVQPNGTLTVSYTYTAGFPVTISRGTTYTVGDGETLYVGVTLDADDNLLVYAGEDTDGAPERFSGNEPNANQPVVVSEVFIGNRSADNHSTFDPWECRWWNVAKTDTEIESLGDGPVTDADDRADLVESWRFAEGAVIGAGPEIVFGEKGLIDFYPVGAGTPTWVSSYEGDDPDLFPGSPAGQTKARTWGPASNVKLTQVDSQRPAYTWHHANDAGELEHLVRRLRHSGLPIVRKHAVITVSSGHLTFDAATNTVTLSPAATLSPKDFRLFVPAQDKPARLGQRVVITNTASNNGTRRVLSVSGDGLSMVLADGPVVDESAPANARIDSHPADFQFEAIEDSLPPRVELPSSPEGDLTADFEVLTDAGFINGQWSEIHAAIAGVTVFILDTDDQYDPVLAYHLRPGENKDKKTVLDELARSAFGWWIERPDGDHDLGTWLPPAGTPVASIGPAHLGARGGVEPLSTVLPRGKFEIAHSPIWHVQDGDALAGSVSTGDRKRWSEPFTIRPVVDRRIRDDRFPLSSEIPRLKTFLSLPEEITAYEALAEPFHFLEARWYRLHFDSLWALFLRRNDCITVTWDDEDLELDATLCRVTGREVDLARGTMELEAFFLKEEPA